MTTESTGLKDLTDSVTLTGLVVRANHGVYPEERASGQDFVLDVTLWLDLAAAASSDDVTATVHYGVLAERIAAAVSGNPVNLIETVADRVARLVLAEPLVERVSVTVHKPQAPIGVPFSDVSVTLIRNRYGSAS